MNERRQAVLDCMNALLRRTERGGSHDDYRTSMQAFRTMGSSGVPRRGKYLLPGPQRDAYVAVRDLCADETLSDEALIEKVQKQSNAYFWNGNLGGEYNDMIYDIWIMVGQELTK